MTSLPRFAVQNPVLTNIFMLTVLAAGAYCGATLVREMFPETDPDRILITTAYPGATPAEVEKGITLKIEEAIKDIDGIDTVKATITEGFSRILVELRNDFKKIDQAVNDIKAAIDTIPGEDWPEEALETHVAKFDPRFPVISVALFGRVEERALKQYGERLRDELLTLPQITDVVLTGTRRDEISVEVSPARLLEYGLSFLDVAQTIAAGNLDLPGGQLKTASANVAVRTLGEKDRGDDLYDLILHGDPTGRKVRVRDVAVIIDGFEDTDVVGQFQGAPAVDLIVYKRPEQDAIRIAAEVRALIAGKTGQPLVRTFGERLQTRLAGHDDLADIHAQGTRDPYPTGVQAQCHSDLSVYIEGRLDLLKRNGLWGLGLVFLSLLIFLNWRVAFWVMMGLILAIAGALIGMKLLGLSLNLLTMFGFIIVLGMLVDDGIIVAENAYARLEQGQEPRLAAITATEEVAWPVVTTVLTTIVAFYPLRYLQGRMGDWMGVLPLVVVAALAMSLLEALTILPTHLAHNMKPVTGAAAPATDAPRDWRHRLRFQLRWLQQHYLQEPLLRGYERALRLALNYRYVTLAALATLMIAVIGLVGGGHVPFVFIQKVDSETLLASLRMGVGTPIDGTRAAARVMEQAALAIPELRSIYTLLGVQLDSDLLSVANPQSHVCQAFLELTPADQRRRTSDEILAELRARTANIPGVDKLKFNSLHGGPGGQPIELEISGENLDDLTAVAAHFKQRLAQFDGVYDVVDDLDAGQPEVQIALLDSARAVGLTTAELATQVRAAFYGFEARKVQRGREDVRIMVRYPPEARRHVHDVEGLYVKAATGRLVPFGEVARLTEGTHFASIHRKDQRRTLTVLADIDEQVTNAERIIAALADDVQRMQVAYPGVRLEFTGQKLETQRSLHSLGRLFLAALLLNYVILAALFKSYMQPLIVMSVVPFGLIGAVLGHLLLGYPLTLLSLIGIVALSGIVVNDSIVLVTFINHRRAAGLPLATAVVEGGAARLRAILLTTVTTVLGIAPLMLETSFQARFMIPMAISISAGLIFATVLTLLAVPALYLTVHDVKALCRRGVRFVFE